MLSFVDLSSNRRKYGGYSFVTDTTTNIDAVYVSDINRLFVLQTDDQNSMIISKFGDLASEELELTLDVGTGSDLPMAAPEFYGKIGVHADQTADSITVCVSGTELNIIHIEASDNQPVTDN